MGERIAVIGAGLAGLACANHLQGGGRTVVVYDRSARPGGRLATRRHAGPPLPPDACYGADHGAQYFTVRDPEFAERLRAARVVGAVATWQPRWPGGEREPLHVGVPGMQAVGRFFAAGLDLRAATQVVAVERDGGRWRVRDALDSLVETYDSLVLAVPAPQAVALAGAFLDARIARVRMLPCWAATVAYAAPLPLALDADWRPHPVLPWLARDRSKPGRRGLDAWVLHAAHDWSAARLESSPGSVLAELLAALGERLAALGVPAPIPEPVAGVAFRWRHARVDNPLGEEAWWDPAQRLGACGDWCIDARVEAAYLSGGALARRMLAA